MTHQPTSILYYAHDPMCSWCWAFQPVWQEVQAGLKDLPVQVEYVLGGLAPDTDEPMPQDFQQMLQTGWQRIQQHVPGTQFNFDFWTKCKPRRSTYPACRAVLAAENQQQGRAMSAAIQQAYYLRAINPSDDETLLQLAAELGLDTEQFAQDLNSAETQSKLFEQIQIARSLPINGFPSFVLKTEKGLQPLPLDYNSAESILRAVKSSINQP